MDLPDIKPADIKLADIKLADIKPADIKLADIRYGNCGLKPSCNIDRLIKIRWRWRCHVVQAILQKAI